MDQFFVPCRLVIELNANANSYMNMEHAFVFLTSSYYAEDLLKNVMLTHGKLSRPPTSKHHLNWHDFIIIHYGKKYLHNH